MILLRGIRGATTVDNNGKIKITNNTAELLVQIVEKNKVNLEDICAVIFSSTADLNAAFPATAARKLGWGNIPLFGTQEIENPNGIPCCIRVLMLWNTEMPQQRIQHVYLREASVLKKLMNSPNETDRACL